MPETQLLNLALPFGPLAKVTLHRFTWICIVCCYWSSLCRWSQITAWRISVQIGLWLLDNYCGATSQNRLLPFLLAFSRLSTTSPLYPAPLLNLLLLFLIEYDLYEVEFNHFSIQFRQTPYRCVNTSTINIYCLPLLLCTISSLSFFFNKGVLFHNYSHADFV